MILSTAAEAAMADHVDLRRDVLFVLAKDPVWQREIERSAALIRSRLADLLGKDVVRFIKVTRP